MAQLKPLREITPKIVTNNTTCLFCTFFVSPRNYEYTALIDMSGLLTHLCVEMDLDAGEIPSTRECNEKRFPFCTQCMNLLNELSELKNSRTDATSQEKIRAVLAKIMRKVLDGEKRLPGGKENPYLVKLKEMNPDVAKNEPSKFMKLRTMILAARERDLMIRPSNSAHVQTPKGLSNSDGSQPGPSRASSIIPGSNALVQPRRSRAPVRSDEQPRPSRAKGSKGTGQPGPSQTTTSAIDEGQHEEARARSASQSRSKRHVIYKGVQILFCVDQQQGEFLKCGVCNHTVLVPLKMKYIKGDFSPKSIMEEHIKCAHKQQPVGRRVYECSRCSESFPTMKALQEHKKEHPTERRAICEICEREFNISRTQIAFAIHQFTHKSDEERGVALDAGERGSFNSFLDPANRRRRVRGSRSPFAKAGRSYPV